MRVQSSTVSHAPRHTVQLLATLDDSKVSALEIAKGILEEKGLGKLNIGFVTLTGTKRYQGKLAFTIQGRIPKSKTGEYATAIDDIRKQTGYEVVTEPETSHNGSDLLLNYTDHRVTPPRKSKKKV